MFRLVAVLLAAAFLIATGPIEAAYAEPEVKIPDVTFSEGAEEAYQAVSPKFYGVLQPHCTAADMLTVEKAWRFTVHVIFETDFFKQPSPIHEEELVKIEQQAEAIPQEIGKLPPRCQEAYWANVDHAVFEVTIVN